MPRAWLGIVLNCQRVYPLAFMSTFLFPMAFEKINPPSFFPFLSISSFYLVKGNNYFIFLKKGCVLLGSVFEKSATELKLKQKLLKCKCTIQIATFNIRIINRIGLLQELAALVIKNDVNIICIQEYRYTHSEDIKYQDIGNGWMLATASAWKNSLNAMIGGVGMLIEPWALKSLNSIEKIQPKMMVATFNGNPSTIISCYSPTNVNEETDLLAFYNELSSLVCSVLKHNFLVLGGDMNAQIAKNVNHNFSIHNSSNRNGEHLTDFMLENRLTYLNTKFQKREAKLWTCTNNTKAHIDCHYKIRNGIIVHWIVRHIPLSRMCPITE